MDCLEQHQHVEQQAPDWAELPRDCISLIIGQLFASARDDPPQLRRAWWSAAGVCRSWRECALPLVLGSAQACAEDAIPCTPSTYKRRLGQPSSLHHVFWHPIHALILQKKSCLEEAFHALQVSAVTRRHQLSTLTRCIVVRTRLSGGRNAFTLYANPEQYNGHRCFVLHCLQTHRLKPTYIFSLSRTNVELGAFATLSAEGLNRSHYTFQTIDTARSSWLNRWLACSGLVADAAQVPPAEPVSARPGVTEALRSRGSSSGTAQRAASTGAQAGTLNRSSSSRKRLENVVCLARMFLTQFTYGSGLPRRLDLKCLLPSQAQQGQQLIRAALLTQQGPAGSLKRTASAPGSLQTLQEGQDEIASAGWAETAGRLFRRSVSQVKEYTRRLTSSEPSTASQLVQLRASSSISQAGSAASQASLTTRTAAAAYRVRPSGRTSAHHSREGKRRLQRHASVGCVPTGGSRAAVAGSSVSCVDGVTQGCSPVSNEPRQWLGALRRAVMGDKRTQTQARAPVRMVRTPPAAHHAAPPPAPPAHPPLNPDEEHISALDPAVTVIVRLSEWAGDEESRVAIAAPGHAQAAGIPAAHDTAALAPEPLTTAVSTDTATHVDTQGAFDLDVPTLVDTSEPSSDTGNQPAEAEDPSVHSKRLVSDQRQGSTVTVVCERDTEAELEGVDSAQGSSSEDAGDGAGVATAADGEGAADSDAQAGATAAAAGIADDGGAEETAIPQGGPSLLLRPSPATSCPGIGPRASPLPHGRSLPMVRTVSSPGVCYSVPLEADVEQEPAKPPGNPRVVRFDSKQPHWNTNMRCWCLNFGGRVRLPSARNFQLCMPEGPGSDHDPARVILQFGKVGQDTFCLDWDLSLMSPAQALACAVTNFHRSWGTN